MLNLINIISLTTLDNQAPTAMIIIILVMGVVVLVLMGIVAFNFPVWIKAMTGKAQISFGHLIGMRLRKVPVAHLVDAMITIRQAGFGTITYVMLEQHHAAGGNVAAVARALAAARIAGMPLTFEHAIAIDLAGRDVVAEVEQVRAGGGIEEAEEPNEIELIQIKQKARGRIS